MLICIWALEKQINIKIGIMKQINFIYSDYDNLLISLRPNEAASMAVSNRNINQVFIEHVGENNHSQNDGFCGEFSLKIAANDSLEKKIIFQTESLNLPNQFITPQKINLTAEKFGSVGYFVNKYGDKNLEKICISEKFFKAGNKLLTAQVSHVNEGKHLGNDRSVQDKSKTIIENGKIYYSSSHKLVEDAENYVFVISKKGDLYINDSSGGGRTFFHHSYFLKGKSDDLYYGYGKPVQCAGHITIKEGKITFFSNASGHYRPNEDQLILSSKSLLDKGVFVEIPKIQESFSNKFLTLDTISEISPETILEKYFYDIEASGLNFEGFDY